MREIDNRIIQKAKNGDKKSFEIIINTYRQTVIEICYRYLRNREESFDMAQEIFITVFNSLKNFEFKSKFSTWLYRICVNACINRYNKLKIEKYYEMDSLSKDNEDDKKEIDLKDPRQNQDEEMELVNLKENIFKCMHDFTTIEKSVVILRDFQGFEYKEISDILNLPIGSVKSKLFRAREKLKNRLKRILGEKNEL